MDRTLVERARDGDHEAFAALAAASVDRIYGVASLILRDEHQADDAVQEALVAAWRGIRALREPDAWTPWLHRLVVRSCYRLAARQRRQRVFELHLIEDRPSGARDVGASVADRDQLERAFRRLAVEHRAVLVLHHYQGLSLTDAGLVLGIPEGTVKSRLHRATSAMRAALDAEERATIVMGEQSA